MRKAVPFLAISISFILLFVSCKNEIFNAQNLLGSWEVKEWKIESTGKLVPNKMDMTFGSDTNYSIDYGPKTEKGKYWIDGEYLHTVATEQAEKKVKIIRLGTDTMNIKMNRGGQMENVILVKK